LIARIWNYFRCLFRKIEIGEGSVVCWGAALNTPYGGSISIGKKTEIRRGAIVSSSGGNIVIGDNCSVNSYCVIYGVGGLTIGNGVRIGTHTTIIPSNHRYDKCDQYIYKQGITSLGIAIEDDVWIGAGVVVLDGVTIARGCVIGANAVVAKSTEPYGVYVGVPAKLIKKRHDSCS